MTKKTKKKPRTKAIANKPVSRPSNNPAGRPQEGGIKQPSFDSMQACSEMTGIPLAVLKFSKDKGCPAHRHGRVYLFDFLKWYWGQNEDEIHNWPAVYEEYRAKREKLKYETEEDKLISADVVEAGLSIAVQSFCAELTRMERDLPAVLKGMQPDQIRAELVKHNLTIKPRIEEAFAGVGKGEAE